MSSIPAVVFDTNSRWLQAGYAGDDAPLAIIPNAVGRGEQKTHPVNYGIITNWDDIEKIWHKMFYDELRVSPKEQPVLLAEPPLNPRPHREKMTEIMFETFQVPGLYIENQAALSLYASGRTTGVVLDSGETVTHVTPIFDGYALPQATLTAHIGGQDVMNYIMQHSANNVKVDENTTLHIKNECYVKLDSIGDTSVYKVNDRVIDITDVKYKCTEILFKSNGVQNMINKAILECDDSIRENLYSNIVLAGGNTMLKGFPKRVEQELQLLSRRSVSVVAPPERKYITFIGGSMFCMDVYEQEMWITSCMYEEYGVDIIHRKCPQTSYLAESQLGTKNLYNRKGFFDIKIT
jgi:actin-related protein